MINALTRHQVLVDAVTLVYEGAAAQQVWTECQVSQQDRLVLAGYKVRPFGLWGYVGRVAGSLAWGRNPRGDVLVAAKSAGVRDWYMTGWLLAGRCTRIDLALDCWVGVGNEDTTIEAAVKTVRETSRRRGAAGRSVRWIQTYGGGDTLYMGQRSSDEYTRCYNKTAESGGQGDFVGVVRLETEFKQGSAKEWYGYLKTGSDASAIADRYISYLSDAGLPGVADLAGAYRGRARIDRAPSDDERTRQWLRDQVSGAAVRLAKAYGVEGILSDLGLLDVARESGLLAEMTTGGESLQLGPTGIIDKGPFWR